MSQKNQSDQLEQYLLGQLSDQEQNDFEKALADNPDLKQALQMEKDLLGGVENYGNQQLREQLKNIHREVISQEENPQRPAKGGSFRLMPLLAAAAVLLLLILAYWNWSANTNSSSTLFAQYYTPHPVSFASRANTSEAQLLAIEALYKDGQYAQALPQIEQLISETPDQASLRLAAGIAQLELGRYEAAQTRFQEIINSQDAFFADHAKWYLALAHLKFDFPELARPLLTELAQSTDADHQAEAQSLLQQLK
ncbi:MAG: tetratricopeptide repeat protein [Bacteroidota bacterium]